MIEKPDSPKDWTSDESPIARQKASWSLYDDYPKEDIEQTDMFRPFFRRKRTWLVILGMLLFGAAFFFIPVEVQQHAESTLDSGKVRLGLGVFAFIAFLWLTEALPLAATALLVPVLASLTGLMDVKRALSDFANPLIYLYLGGFALAAAMSYQGLDRWIANRIILLGRGSFLKASLMLFLVTAAFSMWMSNTATTAMMIPLVMGILSKLDADVKTTRRNGVFLLLGVAYSASIGGIGTVVGSPPNGIAAQQMGLGFVDWMKFGIPTVLVLLPVMILLVYWMCRPRVGEKIEVEQEAFTFNPHRIATLVIFLATALCWVFSRPLGKIIGVDSGLDTIIAISAVLVLLYFRVVRWRDIDRTTDWGVLLLFGGGITLSSVLKVSGASLYLARVFVDLVSGMPLIFVIAAVVMFVIFLTELSSNTATAALLVPIFYVVAGEMGFPVAKIIVPIAVAASCAFMLPVATPPNAIVFGTGRVPQREMMRVGVVLNLTFVVVLALLSQVFLK